MMVTGYCVDWIYQEVVARAGVSELPHVISERSPGVTLGVLAGVTALLTSPQCPHACICIPDVGPV